MPANYVVRYGMMRSIAEFTVKGDVAFRRGDSVILRTNRGMEWGEVLCEATEKTAQFLQAREPAGRILRVANPEDEKSYDAAREREREVYLGGCAEIQAAKLPMQLIDVEVVFGVERAIFYYVSEQRVDFRELVKSLAKRFKLRAEMKQIGVRDEAKLLADYGDCGKPVCCSTHLTEMPPVSMKMAKLQKATLDPQKISGRCGRLKCCLRYEYDTYEEYRRELPKVGKFVITREGKGRVLAQEILAKKLLISYEDHRRVMIDAHDVITVVSGGDKGAAS